MNLSNRKSPEETAMQLFNERYQGAKCIFLAGSVIRGEHTQYSDLDIVVLYDKLEQAYRESFTFNEWPIEAFVHDPSTIKYFFEDFDVPSGFPSLIHMVSEGIVIPTASEFSNELKSTAKNLLQKGPEKLNGQSIENMRYFITNLIDDIRDPKNQKEAMGTASELYSTLANFYFRTNNLWSAKDKTIDRKLKVINEELSNSFFDAFNDIYKNNNSDKIIALTESILKPFGGFLFNGHKLEAPKDWRK